MHLRRCLPILLIATAAAVCAPSALAAPTVSGSIAGARGYTLLAMGHSRIMGLVRLGASGRFSLRTGRDVTLQLLRPDNTFFGPVIIRHDAHRAYEALAGARLAVGRIKLYVGYAATVKRAAAKAVDRGVWASANRSGKPIGAGNLGLLKHVRKARVARVADGGKAGNLGAPLAPGGDPTHVGIITAFNADVTGAGVPNAENPASAQASGDGLFSEIFMPLSLSVNDDAVGVTPAEMSVLVQHDLRLDFYLDEHAAGGGPVTSATVDCGTLVYCASGVGTATVTMSGNTTGPVGVRWDGSVPANPNNPGTFSTQIAPNVGTDQIHPGDVFLAHYQTPSGDVIVPTTLTTYFLTVPTVASYDIGAGPQAISYPAAPDALGTPGNPIMMSSGTISLKIWRPQRAALPGEPGSFYDVGHLHYGAPLQTNNNEVGCGPQFYSNLSPTLQVNQTSQDQRFNTLFPLHDSANDAPADPGNQISFSFDLAGCMAAAGIPVTGQVQLPIAAVDEARRGGSDRAVQTISVCPPGCNPQEGQGPGGGQTPPGGPGPGPGPGSGAQGSG